MLYCWLKFALVTVIYFMLIAAQQTRLLIHSAVNVSRTNTLWNTSLPPNQINHQPTWNSSDLLMCLSTYSLYMFVCLLGV